LFKLLHLASSLSANEIKALYLEGIGARLSICRTLWAVDLGWQCKRL